MRDAMLRPWLSSGTKKSWLGGGPCAGPLVVAAVILKDPFSNELSQVKDSKELTEAKREQLFEIIIENCIDYNIVEITPDEIDQLGLHKCNIEGMRRAVMGLKTSAEYVLTDGYPIPGLTIPNLSVWKGDKVAISISAASILAKVYRDRIMVELDKKYPNYGLASHKGYITALHTDAIKKYGVLPIHRKSFANISAILK